MKQTFVLASFAILALNSCGKKEDFKYQFKEDINGSICDTGEQKAESKDDYCSLLKNEAANKGCAQKTRKEEFSKQGCGNW